MDEQEILSEARALDLNSVAHAYDRVAAKYDAQYADPLAQAENDVVAKILRRHTGGRVLDVGCGTALVLDLLSLDPFEYHGIDVSREMVEEARMKYPDHNFAEGHMESLDEVPGHLFDHIVSTFGSFSYTHFPWQVLWNMHRVLKPGGSLMLMAYTYRRVAEKDWLTTNVPVSRVPYRAKELRKTVASVGFRHVHVRGFGFGLGYPAREYRTLGRVFKSSGRYIVVEAIA